MTDLDKLEAATKLRRILNAHPNTNVYDLPEMAGYAMGYTEQALVHLCVELMEKDHLAAQRQSHAVPGDRAVALEYVRTWQISAGGVAQYHLERNDAAGYDECQRINAVYETIKNALTNSVPVGGLE